MVDELSYMKGMQKQIKLNDIQNLRNFNLKLLKRLLQKREVRIYQVENGRTASQESHTESIQVCLHSYRKLRF